MIKHALQQVAYLNPDAGEIGEGMLRNIVARAQEALEQYERMGLDEIIQKKDM